MRKRLTILILMALVVNSCGPANAIQETRLLSDTNLECSPFSLQAIPPAALQVRRDAFNLRMTFGALQLTAVLLITGTLAVLQGQIPSARPAPQTQPQTALSSSQYAPFSAETKRYIESIRGRKNMMSIEMTVDFLLHSMADGGDALAVLLADSRENVDIQEMVLHSLKKASNPRLTKAVSALINHPRLSVAAIYALGSLRDPAGVPLLIQEVAKDNYRAVQALRTIHSETVEKTLIHALQTSKNSRVRGEAASILEDYPRAVNALIQALSDEDDNVSQVAESTLAGMPDPSVDEAVRAALDPNQTNPALNHLIRIVGIRKDRHAISLLRYHFVYSLASTKAIAVALAQMKDQSSIPLFLHEMTQSDSGRRSRAILALGYLPGPGVEKALIKVMEDDEDHRKQAMASLAKLKSAAAVPTILRHIHEATLYGFRAEYYDALLQIGSPEAIWGLAREAFLENNGIFRYAAIEHLRKAQPGAMKEGTLIDYLKSIRRGTPDEQKILDLYTRANALGIMAPFRLEPRLLEHVLNVREHLDAKDSRPLAVIVFPRDDWNDAFYQTYHLLTLLDAGYRIAFFEEEEDHRVAQRLLEATHAKAAKLIILGAHSNQGMMAFGAPDPRQQNVFRGPRTLDLDDESWLRDMNVGSALEEKGQIIVEGCSVGLGRDQQPNILNMLRRLFPQAKSKGIWGPTVPAGVDQIVLDENNEVRRVEYSHDPKPYQAQLWPPFWRDASSWLEKMTWNGRTVRFSPSVNHPLRKLAQAS